MLSLGWLLERTGLWISHDFFFLGALTRHRAKNVQPFKIRSNWTAVVNLTREQHATATVHDLQEFVKTLILADKVWRFEHVPLEIDIHRTKRAAFYPQTALRSTTMLSAAGIVDQTEVYVSIPAVRPGRQLLGGAIEYANDESSLLSVSIDNIRYSPLARALNVAKGESFARSYTLPLNQFNPRHAPFVLVPIFLRPGADGQCHFPPLNGKPVNTDDVLSIETWNFRGDTAALQRHVYNYCLSLKYVHKDDMQHVLFWLALGGNHRLYALRHPHESQSQSTFVLANVVKPQQIVDLVLIATRAFKLNCVLCIDHDRFIHSRSFLFAVRLPCVRRTEQGQRPQRHVCTN